MTQPTQDTQDKLLVIDDERQILLSLKRLFHKRYQVYMAGSAAEGLDILYREPIHVIICDQRMPGMTGTEFFQQVKTEYPDAIRVILTAYTDVEALIAAINGGNIFRYIHKPWEPPELEGVVQEAFRYYRLINGNRQLMQELKETNSALTREISERTRVEEELRQHRAHLEELVGARTSELSRVNAELQDAKDRADSANRAKSHFLATMSHELRTPLNGILGYAQILQRDQQLTAQQRRGIDVIKNSGEHLLTVINDILDLSKIEAGKFELQANAFSLPNVLENIAAMIHIRVQQKNIIFHYEPAPNLPTMVIGDEKCLRQILLNLLGNAVKFTEQGTVSLQARRSDDCGKSPKVQRTSIVTLQFVVEDTGIGIPDEAQQYIFQPFRQVEGARISREGTGLGLAISQRLAQQMGTRIHLKSVKGHGSCFWFDLNFTCKDSLPISEPIPRRDVIAFKGPRRTVLVTDDSAENREIVLHMLRPLGFECIEAVHGEDALQKARIQPPDLVLIDLVMPGVSGLETIRHFRRDPRLKDLPIVAVSANAFAETRQECLDAGCQDFLAKPFSFESILEILERILEPEWVYREELTAQRATVGEKRMAAPSQERLQELLRAATIGDIMAIRAWVEHEEGTETEFSPFVNAIHRYAQDFQLKQLVTFVQAYTKHDKSTEETIIDVD